MSALIDIDDIEDVIGRPPKDQAEENRWQHYIDAVSAFINGYVTDSLQPVTDDEVRVQADYLGVVNLTGGPVTDVSEIRAYKGGGLITYAEWNGLSEISNLQPLQVVDVTYDHGYATVPEDIFYLVVEAVVGVLNLAQTEGYAPIRTLTVGDVTEVYGAANRFVVTLSDSVLDRYRQTEWTLRLGYTSASSTVNPSVDP